MAKAHSTDENTATESQAAATEESAKPHCGIIMPLSDTVDYPSGHWAQVQRLIIRAAEKAGFTSSMVSENLAEDMIQASIVRNVYHNEVVVCDVSSLNPNVMLELGLRMATLLPLVLVFDGEKDYPFDIRSILHVRYPKGLNIFRMEAFVEELAEKIHKVNEAQKTKEYQPFLSHFKEVKIEPAQLNSTTQSVNEVLQSVVDGMASMRNQLKAIENRKSLAGTGSFSPDGDDPLGEISEDEERLLILHLSQQRIPNNSHEIADAANKAMAFVNKQLHPHYGAAAAHAKNQQLMPRAITLAKNFARPLPKGTNK
jgi:hypothetical protein